MLKIYLFLNLNTCIEIFQDPLFSIDFFEDPPYQGRNFWRPAHNFWMCDLVYICDINIHVWPSLPVCMWPSLPVYHAYRYNLVKNKNT